MNAVQDDWLRQQQAQHGFWRWLIRDFLLHYLGFTLIVKPQVEGLENIPQDAPTILMMNHTIAIDGVIIMGVVRTRDVIPLLKIETFSHFLWGPLARRWGALGIQRGEIDREALKKMLEALEHRQLLLMAPEGTRQRQLIRPKDGLAYLALKSDAVIIPTAISNGETWVRDFLLPRRTHIHVTFGKPFRLKEAGKRIPRDNLASITDEMMYQLAALLPESYRGEYADLTQLTTEHLMFEGETEKPTARQMGV